MKTVTLILPLEATNVNNPSDSREVEVGTIAGAAEQHRSNSRATVEQHWQHSGATAELQQSDSGATAEQQWSNSGATGEPQKSYS